MFNQPWLAFHGNGLAANQILSGLNGVNSTVDKPWPVFGGHWLAANEILSGGNGIKGITRPSPTNGN